MEYLILAVIGWIAVFVLIPLERIRELIMVPIIAFVWIVIVNNISTSLNYYRYTHILIPIGYAPFFHSLAAAAIGLFLINWLTENPLSELASSISASIFLVILRGVYVQLGAFKYGRLDAMLGTIHTLAVLSIFIWISLAVVGREKVYNGIKSRFHIKKLAR